MLWTVDGGVTDKVNSREAHFLEPGRDEMHDAVKSYTWHDVDKKAGRTLADGVHGWCLDDLPGDFVEGVEDHGIPPHRYSNGIVSHCQTVCTDEEAFRVWECPDAQNKKAIDEIAQICKEVMISALLVRVISQWHEIE